MSLTDYFATCDARNAELRLSNMMAHIAAKASLDLRPNTKDSALYNLERVRSYLETHLGASQKETAYELDISISQARYIFRKLRKEWPQK